MTPTKGQTPSEMAMLAAQAIEKHEKEDERRFAQLNSTIDKVDVKLTSGFDALHSRINALDNKFAGRWWQVLISIVSFMALLVVGLVGFIYVSELREIVPIVRQLTDAELKRYYNTLKSGEMPR